MKRNKLPAIRAKVEVRIPEIVKRDSEAMRDGFLLSWAELVKVAARKTPITDATKVHMGIVAMYVKSRATEVHDKGLEIALRKLNGK